MDYIGQLEDNIEDLIDLYARPVQKIILAGHSSGGGLVIRFLAGVYGEWVASAMLFAPLLEYNAPQCWGLVAGVGAADHRVVAAEQRRSDRVKPSYCIAVCLPGLCLQSDLKTALTRAYSYCLTLSYAPAAIIWPISLRCCCLT